MKLMLNRIDESKDGIFGELYLESGSFLCHTAEHAYIDENGAICAKVPQGEYVCKLGEHTLEKHPEPFMTYEIQNVPGHDHILFHVGNYPQTDSHGCILVGHGIGATLDKKSMLTSSKQAFQEFMKILLNCDEFTLIVSDAYKP